MSGASDKGFHVDGSAVERDFERDGVAVSQAAELPWVATRDAASAACTALGPGFSLINNKTYSLA